MTLTHFNDSLLSAFHPHTFGHFCFEIVICADSDAAAVDDSSWSDAIHPQLLQRKGLPAPLSEMIYDLLLVMDSKTAVKFSLPLTEVLPQHV